MQVLLGFVRRAKVDPLKLPNSGFSGSGLSRCGVSLGNVGLHVAEDKFRDAERTLKCFGIAALDLSFCFNLN